MAVPADPLTYDVVESILEEQAKDEQHLKVEHRSTTKEQSIADDLSTIREQSIAGDDSNLYSENETLLSYEETIHYAEFPALDLKGDDKQTFVDNTYLTVQHTEVFDPLTWLRDQKGVKRIVELKVPDRLINAHEETCIAEFVESFEVEHLDWRCLDLSLSVLGSSVTGSSSSNADERMINDKIKELHLYSRGRTAAIDYWLEDDGIPILAKESVFLALSRSIFGCSLVITPEVLIITNNQ
ncbi:hypothetical protein GGI42DRAFT_358914 [Trichoderma sp. SZMC 28013]